MAVPFRAAGGRSIPVIALVVLTAGSWLALLGGSMAGDSIGSFLVGWLVMMTAMMLPAAMPMIRIVRLATPPGRWGDWHILLFVTGYLMLWTALGIVALVARSTVTALGPTGETWAAIGVLALAGAYEFSPLKHSCLTACRSPMDFVVLHWRSGAAGALRLGIDHGLYCIGCCWALMAVLVIAGGMGLGWVAGIALVVFAEKVLPGNTIVPRAVGVALLVSAGLIAIWPWLLPTAATTM